MLIVRWCRSETYNDLKMPVKRYHLFVLVSAVLCGAVAPGLQTAAACTAASLSVAQFEVKEEDIQGQIGGSMSFYCCQRGSSQCAEVQQAEYYFNGSPINTSNVDKYNTENEGGAQLIVLDLSMTDQGQYTCSCPDTGLSPEDEDSGIVLLCESTRMHALAEYTCMM